MNLEIFLPLTFDLYRNKFIEKAEIGEFGYLNGEEINLQISFLNKIPILDYYSEDDYYLFDINEFYLNENDSFKDNQISILNFLLSKSKGKFKQKVKNIIKNNI